MTDITWAITDHICRSCGGRILRSVTGAGMTPGGNSIYRCADCWASTTRMGPDEVCWCGFAMKGSRQPAYMCIPVSMARGNEALMQAIKRCGYNDRSNQEVAIILRADWKEIKRAEEGA